VHDWLPTQKFCDFNGGIEEFRRHCFLFYEEAFVLDKPTWPVDDRKYGEKREPFRAGLPATYAHLTSSGKEEDSRTPDLERLERITWPRLILDEFASCYPRPSNERIAWWVEKRRSEYRYHIALSDFTYLVVVAARTSEVLLWTAFPIEFNNQRRKREKKFSQYWEGRNG